tara:strand:+ start:9584 stop:10678 length:1095 start_codon:yes stop_codon:yes gene_type:complete
MGLKNIIIFFPNFSKGGIEKISSLLTNFFYKKKIRIKFISFNNIDYKKYNFSKGIDFYYNKNNIFFLNNLYCSFILFKILLKQNKKDTIIFSLQNNVLSIIISKILGFKIVARNSAPIDYSNNQNNLIKKFKLSLKMKIYSYSDLIISNSKSSANKIKAKLKIKKKIISIPNPILRLENKVNKIKRKNKILYVGRLSSEKGIFQLIEGFKIFQKKNPQFFLDIVGDGNQKENLINFIKDKKLTTKVNLITWTNDLSKYYKHSKILILPSFFEGFGNVLIEALNFCLPCISNNNDGPKEILNYGKYGLLMKNNNPITINNSLTKVIKNYNFYKSKSIAGFKNNKKYHINFIGNQYLNKIKNTLKN